MPAVGSPGSGFFTLDSRIWAKATTLGMNEATAYLVLASGTGHDNKTTSWSTNAVMKHAGIGWERSKLAIVNLVTGGFVHRAAAYTEARPRYELTNYRELVEFEAAKNPPARPDIFEEELLCAIRAGKQPTNKADRIRAERLLQRGLLCRGAQGIYKLPELVTEDSIDYSIWLPNAIATGTSSGEESPVRKLRSAGCIWTLRLYVEIHRAQNLRDDGGIGRSLVWQEYERLMIGQQGPYIIWGFKPGERYCTRTGPFAAHQTRVRVDPERDPPAWESLKQLENFGLFSFVPHILENDTDVAEPIHPYGIGGIAEAAMEYEIGNAADCAARAMALPSKLEEAEEAGFEYFCPVLKTKPDAQMIGVARLTYRLHTRRTKEWFAELNKTGQGWIDLFGKLAVKGGEATVQRKANFA